MRPRVISLLLSFPLFLFGSHLFSSCVAQKRSPESVEVHLVTDEADAVLTILAKNKSGESVTAADWERLFSSEGYLRLKKRELSLKRPFADVDFKAFVLSDDLGKRAAALGETLRRWKSADVMYAAEMALAYLPKGASIRARIYPVIKPATNSFVFEVKENPAIFLYLDPEVTRAQLENTLAHELHHIGYGGGCPTAATEKEIARLPETAKTVLNWIGAFGEGFAMLAAAGGPEIHPHAVSAPAERERWDRDVANFNPDLKKVEAFFLDVLNHRLSAEQVQQTAFSFFGIQGPWYTVGWKMAVLIEKTFGRARLIECICDQRKLLPLYNRAATLHNRRSSKQLAVWSPEVLKAIAQRGDSTNGK